MIDEYNFQGIDNRTDPAIIDENIEKNCRFDNQFEKKLVNRINDILFENHIQRKDFYSVNKCTKGSLSNYLTGNREVPIVLIHELFKRTGFSADYILGYSDDKTIDVEEKTIINKTGLHEGALQEIRTINEDTNKSAVLNLLFTSGIINKIIELVLSNIEFGVMLKHMSEQDISIKEALTKQCEYINYTYEKNLSQFLYQITEMLSRYYDKPKAKYTDINIQTINKIIDELKIFHLNEEGDE